MRRSLALIAVVLAAVAAGAASYAALSGGGGTKTVVRQVTVASGQPTAVQRSVSDVTDVYNRTSKGVVEITVSSTASSPFGGSRTQQAPGSGFVYAAAAHIVTN